MEIGTALGLCHCYLAAEPDDADMYRRKSDWPCYDPRRLNEALDAIEGAIKIVERPDFFELRGRINLARGKFKEALGDLRRFADAQASAPAETDAAIAEACIGLKDASRGNTLIPPSEKSARRLRQNSTAWNSC